jgi:hypothetical protein
MMYQYVLSSLRVLATLACLVAATISPSTAAPILTTPAGLSPGDTFRFVFVTGGTTQAFGTNHAFYDNFVNAQAEGATYDGNLITWKVIGSTGITSTPVVAPAIAATTHIGVNPGIAGLFRVDGVKVTTGDGPTGLWSGSLLAPIQLDINGIERFGEVYTGTEPNGIHANSNELTAGAPLIGNISETSSLWVYVNSGRFAFNFRPLYGISEVLTVPVPEPTSLILLLSAGGLMVLRRR